MIHLDTSVVLALLIPEGRTAQGIKQQQACSQEARAAAGEPFARLPQCGMPLLQDPGPGLQACDALHLAVATVLGLSPALS